MIADIITNPASFSLPALLTVVGAFGFAPGFCMRLIALMYPPSDPRRHELYAEMKAVPRIERPLWVAEQLETGLFEGVASRRRAARERKRKMATRKGNEQPTAAAKIHIEATEIRDVRIYIPDRKEIVNRQGVLWVRNPDGTWREPREGESPPS